MLFLPFDAFGAYNQGKKEANAENWADIFNNEKAEQAMQRTDLGAATFDTSVGALNAQNQMVINKGDIGNALQPGALSSADLSSTQQIDYNARLAPLLPTVNQNKVDAAVAGSSNDLFRQQAVVPAQSQNLVAKATVAVADQQWQADGGALAALGTARGNSAGLTTVIAKYYPGATVVEGEGGYAVQMPNGGGLVPFAAVASGLQERFRPNYRTAANGTVSEAAGAGGGAGRPAAAAKPGAVVPAASVLGINKPAAPAAAPAAPVASAPAPAAPQPAPAAVQPVAPAAPAAPADPRLQAIDQQIASVMRAAGALPLGSQERATLLEQTTQLQMQRAQLAPPWWRALVPSAGVVPNYATTLGAP